MRLKGVCPGFQFIVTSSMQDMFLVEFKSIEGSALAKDKTFTAKMNKEDTEFTIYPKDNEYQVKNMQITKVLKNTEAIMKHWLGLQKRMDLLTRLMYGGRVSLILVSLLYKK